MPDSDSLNALRHRLEGRLLELLEPEGCWRGRLSSSALANALACIALQDSPAVEAPTGVEQGVAWLCGHRNEDGGWGDTPDSPSNLSTTLLCRAALRHTAVRAEPAVAEAVNAAAAWTQRQCGVAEGPALAGHVQRFYGDDRTFAAPILAVCAHAGLLGQGGWRVVPSLPLELALLPNGFYRRVRLPVVSYALPALIAVGMMIRSGRSKRPSLRYALMTRLAAPLLRKLRQMQPTSGGYLEAIPLTAFVVIGLTAAGCGASPVVTAATDFLIARRRPDGSWPIDTDLATWLTCEAVKTLDSPGDPPHWPAETTRDWILRQQTTARHPFTGAAPGGWGWTDHPGAVPDGDDTSGALLALRRLAPSSGETRHAAERGVEWLVKLQNRDGGVPTFCRGWGRLPFDRSCPDITAHAVAGVAAWLDDLPTLEQNRAERFLHHAAIYLLRTQTDAGSWVPLWFGNQRAADQRNPVFGTARVLTALATEGAQRRLRTPQWQHAIGAALDFLESARHDGGACAASVEETAAATAGLLAWGRLDAAAPGIAWLEAAWSAPREGNEPDPPPAPIGLYFQSLWYSESLYPLIFTLHALRQRAPAPDGTNPCAAFQSPLCGHEDS